MIAPQYPENEFERLNELYKYELLDTAYEEEFDDIVRLASKLCNVPISLITLVDMNRQWFKAKVGLDLAETERSVSFCGHAVLNTFLFEVEDAVEDERFSDNPLVTGEPKIRYYGGMPLVTQNGYKIGTLCVIDRVPRHLEAEQSFALSVLSKQVIKLFEQRILNKELKKITGLQQKIMTIMAHDIRGPLASLKVSYELKNSGLCTEAEAREMDAMVPLQLEGTIQLLNNITDWGKLQLSSSFLPPVVYNLHDLCTECFNYILLSARAKNNKLTNAVNRSMNVSGKPQGIEFILRNLLGNANKFTSSGEISVFASMQDNNLEISVKDTGVGMSEAARHAITERNWPSHTLGTHNEKGSGMGLKLVFEYLAEIKGNILFTSAPGAGTTVLVTIPQM